MRASTPWIACLMYQVCLCGLAVVTQSCTAMTNGFTVCLRTVHTFPDPKRPARFSNALTGIEMIMRLRWTEE
ncbi:uncharacterized protein V1518DRAFT_421629 [Limtongia smithiae]|uniref:uncharacterized protein n=1 Tax=Limtongia smithiae TaxID=1125753 RepID=UPI0034CF17B3